MSNPNIKAKQQEKQRDAEQWKREIAVVRNRPAIRNYQYLLSLKRNNADKAQK